MKNCVATAHRIAIVLMAALMLALPARGQNGTWNVDANGLWSAPTNWLSDTIASGSGFTANFTNDITADRTVSLDSDRTLTNVVFGDGDTTSAGSWVLNNNGVSTNNLILAGTTPTITVNALGTGKNATISAIIEGSAGLTKAGAGTLILSGTNTYTGTTVINSGVLTLGNNSALGSSAAGSETTINGGTSSFANLTNSTVLDLGSTALTLPESFILNGSATGRATIYNNAAVAHVLNGNIDATSATGGHAQIRNDNNSGSITVNGNITGTLGANTFFYLRGTSTSTNNRLLGDINISGDLAKTDGGTWTIGAASKTYAWGATNVQLGSLRMGRADVLPSTTVVTLGQNDANPATLDLNGFSQTVAGIQLAATPGTGPRTITSSTAATLTVGDGNSYSYGGVLTGTGLALTKTGAGTLTLTNANTYSGLTTVNGGELRWGIANALGSGDLTVNSGGTVNMQTFTDSLGTIRLNRGTISNGSSSASLKTGAGGFITTGGTVNNWPGIGLGGNFLYSTDSGNETTANIGAIDFNSGARTFTITDGVQAIDVNVSTSLYSASAGNFNFTKAGPGTMRISGAAFANYNLGTGTTSIQDGVLLLNKSGNNAVGGTGVVTVGDGTGAAGSAILRYASTGGNDQIPSNAITINSDGLFDLADKTDTVGTVTLQGGSITSTTGVLTSTAAYAFLSGSASARLAGSIGLNKTTTGTVTLSGANSYTGATAVSAGVLNVQNATALGTTAAGTSVTTGAALEVEGGITVGTEALTLNGTGISSGGALRNISGTNNYGGLVTLGSATRINSDAGTLSLTNAGTITGSGFGLTVGGGGNVSISSIIDTSTGTLTKEGAGTLTLSATNTYTGATSVNAGTLFVNGSLAAGSAVSVGASGTLGGTGMINGAATILGAHTPGNSPGIQTFGSNLTYSGGSSAVEWELVGNTITNAANPNAVYDQILVNGNLDFAGATSLSLLFNGLGSSVLWADQFWDADQQWTLYDVAGSTTNFGNLSLAAGSYLDSASNPLASARPNASFNVIESGSDVVISYVAVPEPSTLALAGLGLAAGLGWILHRRKG